MFLMLVLTLLKLLTMTPTPEQIRELRGNLTQPEFGKLVHSKRRTVQAWEAGTAKMHPALWELAKLKLTTEK